MLISGTGSTLPIVVFTDTVDCVETGFGLSWTSLAEPEMVAYCGQVALMLEIVGGFVICDENTED